MRKMAYFGGLLALAILLSCAVAVTVAQEVKKCDLSKVETAYKCPQCGDISDAEGTCPKGCKDDAGNPVALKKIDVCVKTGYVCDDGNCSLEAGKCDDGKDRVEKVVKSEVVYKCPKCGAEYEAPGVCTKECKDDAGAAVTLEKTCKDSGKCPHVAA